MDPLVADKLKRGLGAWFFQAVGGALLWAGGLALAGWLILSGGAALIGDTWRPSVDGALRVAGWAAVGIFALECVTFVVRAVRAVREAKWRA